MIEFAPRLSVRSRRHWWTTFLTGASAGVVAGLLLGRLGRGSAGNGRGPRAPRETPRGGRLRMGRPADAGLPDEGEHGERGRVSRFLGEAWSDAWEETLDGLASVRERVLGSPEVDLIGLQLRLDALPGGQEIRVRDLGDGIVEVVGSAPDAESVEALVSILADEPGVDVVVNRVWTPESAAPQPN